MAKKKVGRPTRYKKEFCQMLIEHMEQGLSFDTFAGVIGVNRDSLYEWKNTHKEFSDAKGIATAKRNLFVEKMFTAAAIGREVKDPKGNVLKFQPAMMVYWTKNTLGWTDKIEQVGEVQVAQRLIINPPKTSDE
jgi:hypothetical protein